MAVRKSLAASGLTSIRATDGQQLWDSNRQLFEDSVYRLFAEMGVNVGETAGGPLEINDVPIKVEAGK